MLEAIIINIGDEILIGQTLNTNSHEMAKMLNGIGVSVVRMITTSDQKEDIIEALEESFKRVSLVLTTGGLGPTHDDITKVAIADFFNRSLQFDEETYEKIKSYFASRKIPLKEAHRKQCYMPSGTELIENKEGTAPGMWIQKGDQALISLPGVPREMRYIMSNGVIPKINQLWNRASVNQYTFRTFGVEETRLAEMIEDVISGLSKELKIAFLPSLGEVKIRLQQIGSSDSGLREFDEVKKTIAERIGDYVYGKNEENLEYVLGQAFREKSLSIATAESCTGGRLANRIVSIPGASQYFLGSTITYENELKTQWLGVKTATLEAYGAVSQEVVTEMLQGILQSSSADIGVSISGVAGPGGGTPQKPVGTIWVAWGSMENVQTKKLELWKDRKKNIEFTCSFCLNALIKFLKNY